MVLPSKSLLLTFFILLIICNVKAYLQPSFYDDTCPCLTSIVQDVMTKAVSRDKRMGASILRLFFHDCFVQGCDASILLDDVPGMLGEKTALPNVGTVRGYEVIDAIKTRVEAACSGIVSCADILALAARDGIVLLGGPSWEVPLGRRDARTASFNDANNDLPPPIASLSELISFFEAKGLSAADMTVLSGSHTVGQAQCSSFREHIYNDTNIDNVFASERRSRCPRSGGDDILSPLDFQTPIVFDNRYYQNLIFNRGLLKTDQELFSGGSVDALVHYYAEDENAFRHDFAAAMIKMGNINPLTGYEGEIRVDCRRAN